MSPHRHPGFAASTADDAAKEGSAVSIHIERIGNLPGRIIAKSHAGIHLQFVELTGDVAEKLQALTRSEQRQVSGF